VKPDGKLRDAVKRRLPGKCSILESNGAVVGDFAVIRVDYRWVIASATTLKRFQSISASISRISPTSRAGPSSAVVVALVNDSLGSEADVNVRSADGHRQTLCGHMASPVNALLHVSA
jgi:hypothetical protein